MRLILKLIINFSIISFVTLVTLLFWLKTDFAKVKITNFIENVLNTQLGIKANIEGLKASLPIILTAENITLSDQSGEFVKVKDFRVNILPSFTSLREIIIENISATEIHLLKQPEFNVPKNEQSDKNSSFGADILIKYVNFDSLILDRKFSGLSQDIVISINSNIDFSARKQVVNYSLLCNLKSPQIEKLSDNEIELSGTYNLKKNILNILSMKLMSEAFDIKGNVEADNDKLSGIFQYNMKNISNLDSENIEGVKSIIIGQIGINGKLSAPEINLKGTLDIDSPQNEYLKSHPISFDNKFYFKSQEVRGFLQLKQDNMNINGQIKYKNNKLYLDKISAEAPDFLQIIDLNLDTNTNIIKGNIKFTDKSLKTSSKYFSFLKSGAADLQINFLSPDNRVQKVKIDGNLKRINTQYGLLGYATFDLDIIDLWKAKLGDSVFKMRSFNYNNIFLKETKIEAKSINNSIATNVHISSGQPYPVNLKFNGNFTYDTSSNDLALKITNLSGKLKQVPIKQNEDINIKVAKNSTIRIKDLSIGQGYINFNGKFGDDVKASLEIRKMPIAGMPDIFSDIFDKSLIDADAILSGTNAEPRLNASLLFTSLNHTKDKDLSVAVKASYLKNKIKTDIKFLKEDKKLADFALSLPVKISFDPLNFQINRSDEFSLNLSSYEDFDLVSFFPMPIEYFVSGNLRGSVNVKGTITNPKISGKMFLSNGEYEYKTYGVYLKNITATLEPKGNNIVFNDLVMEDNAGNKASGSGKFLLKDDNKFIIDLITKKLYPMDTRYLQGQAKGNIKITGNNRGAKAEGDLELGPLEIKILQNFRQEIPALNIFELTEDGYTKNVTSEDYYKLNLDINLKANEKVFIRGWGVDVQLQGKLHITGDTYNPIVTGVLNSKRGKYQEFGKVLFVKKGVLNFDGPISPSPYLNIVGFTQVGNTEINLILSGSIFNPEISIESTPPLSQERALSRLLFGENPEDISTFQALQLADGARRLSGKGANFDPFSLGRKILPVDDISIKQDSANPNNSSIGIGKHLSDKIYFEIERGRSENSTKAKIEVQISPKLSVESKTEQEGNSSVGLVWRFDY
jgi:autotransporter translocation and assembly factor TamB